MQPASRCDDEQGAAPIVGQGQAAETIPEAHANHKCNQHRWCSAPSALSIWRNPSPLDDRPATQPLERTSPSCGGAFDLCSVWAIDAEVGAIGVAAHATIMTQIGFALCATNDAAVLSLSSGQMSTRRATVRETQSRRQLRGAGSSSNAVARSCWVSPCWLSRFSGFIGSGSGSMSQSFPEPAKFSNWKRCAKEMICGIEKTLRLPSILTVS